MSTLTIGKAVWWDDPDGQNTDPYVVDEIKTDPGEGLYDDTKVIISNDKFKTEVEAWELQDLDHRRKCISDFVAKVTGIAKDDGWSVHNYNKSFDKVDIYFSKYSNAGQDFGFDIECKTGDLNEFINAVEDYYDSYDPSEEAALWLGPDGHGKNGAPYDLEDLLNDMKECKENVKNLLDTFKEKLQGKKKVVKTLNSRYSDQISKLRSDIIESIYETLYQICRKRGIRSITWEVLTNEEYPDICVASEGDNWCNLPEVVGLDDDKPNSFYIAFAPHSDCPTSFNGENIYTETLIDILVYLENYRSKL